MGVCDLRFSPMVRCRTGKDWQFYDWSMSRGRVARAVDGCVFARDRGWRILGWLGGRKRAVDQGQSRRIKANQGGNGVWMGVKKKLGQEVGEWRRVDSGWSLVDSGRAGRAPRGNPRILLAQKAPATTRSDGAMPHGQGRAGSTATSAVFRLTIAAAIALRARDRLSRPSTNPHYSPPPPRSCRSAPVRP